MGESLLTHVGTADNLAGLLTKPFFGEKHKRLVSGILYNIYDKRNEKTVTLTFEKLLT
jgi:hypothetical protein